MLHKPVPWFRICFILVLLFGCIKDSLNFQIRYENVSGLKKNDSVYFKQNRIGQIKKVTYTTQGDYLVDVTVFDEFKNAATVDSKFYIDTDPLENKLKAVIIEQAQPGGKLLSKGDVVEGSVRSHFLEQMSIEISRNIEAAKIGLSSAIKQLEDAFNTSSHELDKDLEKALDDLSEKFQELEEQVRQVPESPEFKELEKSLKTFADEFKNAEEEVRDYIREEVLPELKKSLDKLRERMKRQGREKEFEQIDKEFEAITKV